MGRLTNNDKHFGPVTYGKTTFNPIRMTISSADDIDESIGDSRTKKKCSLIVYLFGYVYRIYLPNIIKPFRIKTIANWNEETVKRLGRNWYYEYFKKEYGFSIHDGFLQLFYGIQSDDDFKVKSESKSWFFPWRHNRLVEYTIYTENNDIHFTVKNNKGVNFDEYYDRKISAPATFFTIKDHDEEIVTAKVIKIKRVYKKGDKKFKWISWFTKTIIDICIEVEFNKEVGLEKGSWKGGMVGTSMKVLEHENIELAMIRFCEQDFKDKAFSYKLTYINKI